MRVWAVTLTYVLYSDLHFRLAASVLLPGWEEAGEDELNHIWFFPSPRPSMTQDQNVFMPFWSRWNGNLIDRAWFSCRTWLELLKFCNFIQNNKLLHTCKFCFSSQFIEFAAQVNVLFFQNTQWGCPLVPFACCDLKLLHCIATLKYNLKTFGFILTLINLQKKFPSLLQTDFGILLKARNQLSILQPCRLNYYLTLLPCSCIGIVILIYLNCEKYILKLSLFWIL